MIVLAKINNKLYAGERSYSNWELGKVPRLPIKLQFRAEELYYETPLGDFACIKSRYNERPLAPLSREDATVWMLKASPINWKDFVVNAVDATSSTGPK